MVERRNLKAAMIVLAAGAVIQLYAGVEAGLREDWMRMRMSLGFFGSVFAVFVAMIVFLRMKLDDHFVRLADRFQMDSAPVPAMVRRIEAAVSVFMVLSGAAHMILSVVAGFREDWLRLAIHLTACAITVVVCTGVLAMMSIGTRLARLEQLPAGTRKAENA